VLAKRLHDLRLLKGWSQPEVAKKLAEAFGVTLDSLVSWHEQSAFVQDNSTTERVRAIGELSPDECATLLYEADGLLRDARARRACAAA
jgi:transcriptional regulator with XRE-family HTH domain